MKHGLIITGGSINLAFAGSFLKEQGNAFDSVIAVDAGLRAVHALGLKPDAIVGDFDTIEPEILEKYKVRGDIAWEIHQPEKDETDTELAILTAIRMGCKTLTILGATGGRMDHGLGNIQLLYLCLSNGIEAYILDPQNRIYLLDKGRLFNKTVLWGKYISFLPFSWEVKGITLEGFKYPLCKKDIAVGTSLCISNELIEEEARLSFSSGILICVESHD